jgi:succinoglycan biosynthesis transport protein ExoP
MPTANQLPAVAWRRRFTAILTAVCVLAAVAAVTFSLPKTYSTSAYLVVNTAKPTTSDFEAQQVSQVDTQTAAQLLQTRNAADLVSHQLPFALTPAEVQSKTSISAIAQTQLVLITAEGSSPLRAQQLANVYADAFTRTTAPTISYARISVTEPAPLVTTPSAPRVSLFLIIGAVLALAAGLAAAVVRDRLDRRLRVEGSETELMGLPVLARVPDVRSRRWRRGGAPDPEDPAFREGFQWVFANLSFVNGGERPAVIAIVSAAEREGKSTVSLALARAAEETLGGGVALIDADLRRPTLGPVRETGLADFLLAPERYDLDDLGRAQPDSNLQIVPAGRHRANPAALLGGQSLREFIGLARRRWDFVVLDTPPLRAGADATLIASRADGAVLVLNGAASRHGSVKWSVEQLRRAGVQVLGVVINRSSEPHALPYYGHDPADPGSAELERMDSLPSSSLSDEGSSRPATVRAE